MTLWESLPRERIRVPLDALSREITVPPSSPGAVSLSAAERLAARLYADLTTLAGPNGDGLRRTLAGHPFDASELHSETSTVNLLVDDPQLALRLVTADIEQLWRDQLIAAAALALVTLEDAADASSSAPSGVDPPAVRCLLVYRVRPWSAAHDEIGADRAIGGLELSTALPARLPRGRLALLLSWTPAVARRSWVFPRQVYTFHWEPVSAVALERTAPPIADHGDDADEWMICRPRRPSALS